MRRFTEVDFADLGVVDGCTRVCEELDVDDDEPNVVPHEPDHYREVMLPAVRPSGRGRLARFATDEPEVVVGPAEDGVVGQRLEAVDAQIRHGETVATLAMKRAN